MKSTIFRLLTLVFLFSAFLANSQTSLVGEVTDANSGEKMIFASVGIFQNNKLIVSTETDLNGNYIFSEIEAGIYTLEASYIGYESQRQVGVIIKSGIVNKIDFTLAEGSVLDEIIITKDKSPKVKKENSISGSTMTASRIRSLPTKNINAISNSLVGKSSAERGPISIRGSRSEASVLYVTEGISISNNNIPLPESGQITAGEWNDLHNWKDWTELLKNEEYGIMTNRFDIYPTQRFSVLAINKDNAVLPNISIKLKDEGNNTIWEAITDNAGKAELWGSPFKSENNEDINYTISTEGKTIRNPKSIDEGSNTIVLNVDCNSPQKMDIVFTVDATSSMNDEIQYLKSELLDVIDRIQETNEDIEYRTGAVFYRDVRDDYLTRVSPLTTEKEEIVSFVKEQNANGGGDKPEAVEEALEKTLNLDWDQDALKLVFLILDAPPHEDDTSMQKIRTQIQKAAKKGIKIIPITASGIGRETEFLMKFMSIMTNGSYIFITDDSGIGNPHLDPVVTDYEVEKLNDCIVRLISQYSTSYSCDADNNFDDININVYPNPSTQFVNVETENTATKINILSSNGKVVRSIYPTEKLTKIQLDELVNGVYTLAIYFNDRVESRQIIILR